MESKKNLLFKNLNGNGNFTSNFLNTLPPLIPLFLIFWAKIIFYSCFKQHPHLTCSHQLISDDFLLYLFYNAIKTNYKFWSHLIIQVSRYKEISFKFCLFKQLCFFQEFVCMKILRSYIILTDLENSIPQKYLRTFNF